MSNRISTYKARIKQQVDGGCSLAEAVLKTFADDDITPAHHPMYYILDKFAIHSTTSNRDYYFVDGSCLSIDPIAYSMTATKGFTPPTASGR